MRAQATRTTSAQILPFRERQREEMNCQIVHDSIHRRPGWALTYALELHGVPEGFGSVAISGPWKDKPTVADHLRKQRLQRRLMQKDVAKQLSEGIQSRRVTTAGVDGDSFEGVHGYVNSYRSSSGATV